MKKNQCLFMVVVLVIWGVTLQSCYHKEDQVKPRPPVGEVEGYKPVYGKAAAYNEDDDLQKLIEVTPAIPLAKPGKIYFKDGYVFINEPGKGIHIIDNSNPRSPKQLKFLVLKENHDMAMRNNLLYADMKDGLITIDISDVNNIRVAGYTGKVFSYRPMPVYPPRNPTSGNKYTYFECVDNTQGDVIGWEKTTLINPTCFN